MFYVSESIFELEYQYLDKRTVSELLSDAFSDSFVLFVRGKKYVFLEHF